MVQETRVAIVEDRELALREQETRFALAVRQRELLEQYIRERLKPDKHFYTVGDDPGRKPSLTKEGAELICLPHNLKPRYIVLSGPDHPPTDTSPYQLTLNCSLWRNQDFEGEGIGSASSYITKKDSTYQPRQKDPGLCYNATVKMACKSAYIAATLNSTAASEFFTQDLEDDQTGDVGKQETKGHWCSVHKTVFFMKGKMKSYAHPIKDKAGKDTGDWCHEHSKTIEPDVEKAEQDSKDLWPEPDEEPRMSKAEIEDAKGEPAPAQLSEVTKSKSSPPKAEAKVIPPEKDESPVTNEDIANLKKLMEKAAMGAVELGKMMVNSPLNWRGIKEYKDLKKWQYQELVDILRGRIR